MLGERLRRIFIERGFDFFEKQKGALLAENPPAQAEVDDDSVQDAAPTKIMSTEELFRMRMEILPQLL